MSFDVMCRLPPSSTAMFDIQQQQQNSDDQCFYRYTDILVVGPKYYLRGNLVKSYRMSHIKSGFLNVMMLMMMLLLMTRWTRKTRRCDGALEELLSCTTGSSLRQSELTSGSLQ